MSVDTSLPFGNIVFKALLLEAATSGWNIRTVRTTASSCTFWSFSLSACQPVSLSASANPLGGLKMRHSDQRSRKVTHIKCMEAIISTA